MSDIGSIKVQYPLLIFISIFLLLKRRILSILFLWITLYSIRFLNFELKEFFHRERPSFDAVIEAAHYSFPSGHSMNSAAVYGFICYLLIEFTGTSERRKKRWIAMSVLLICLIGTSRIYLGVHFLSDVLAGFSAGMAWLLILIKVYETIKSKIIDKTRPT
jgi:undecaprenyl-diphosphatase